MRKKLILYVIELLGMLMCVACGNSEEINENSSTATEITTMENVLDATPIEAMTEEQSIVFNKITYEEDTDKIVETQGQKQNQSEFMVDNNWIYCPNWTNDTGAPIFVKERIEGGDYTKLDTVGAQNIYSKDGYIYYSAIYTDSEDEQGIYKMRSSGEGKIKIVDKKECDMQIVNDYIYYSADMLASSEEITEEYSHLFRCDLEGNNEVEIIEKPVFCWYVFGNCILYQDDRDNESLHICDLDGQNDKKINDSVSYNPIYDGEYIYYAKSEKVEGVEKCTIWKIKPDGTKDEKVADYYALEDFCLHNEFIYFSYLEDEGRLYRMKKDGSELTLISQDKNIMKICFLGDMLKYNVYDQEGYILKVILCDEDGSNANEFNMFEQ